MSCVLLRFVYFDGFLDNSFDEGSCCALLPSFLKCNGISSLSFEPAPIICIRSDCWRTSGFPVPSDEIIVQSRNDSRFKQWLPILEFLRAGLYAPVHELRLMLIGDGEVGKTSLIKAFHTPDHKAQHEPSHVPTIGIDFSPLEFPSSDLGPAITCQVCDFAGQESYLLSHSLHFSRRSLYVLMWTSHKFNADGTPERLDLDDILRPLKRWLQLLAANVPEANVAVVGTHCMVDPDAFEHLRKLVDDDVRKEHERLAYIANMQASETWKVFFKQQTIVTKLREDISTMLTSLHLPIRLGAPQLEPDEVKKFCDDLRTIRPTPKRPLRKQAKSLIYAVVVANKTKLRLSRIYGLYDGSLPSRIYLGVPLPAAHLKLLQGRSFVVDSIAGFGVAGLLQSIETTCRDRNALPFMGEDIPVSWLQVKAALQLQPVTDALGDIVLPLTSAVAIISAALKGDLGIDVGLARGLNDRALQRSLEFFVAAGTGICAR
jgi:GTPase SAR1 family protein